jgi:hypothetical protein
MERQHYGNVVSCDGREQRFSDGGKEFHEGSLETFERWWGKSLCAYRKTFRKNLHTLRYRVIFWPLLNIELLVPNIYFSKIHLFFKHQD